MSAWLPVLPVLVVLVMWVAALVAYSFLRLPRRKVARMTSERVRRRRIVQTIFERWL